MYKISGFGRTIDDVGPILGEKEKTFPVDRVIRHQGEVLFSCNKVDARKEEKEDAVIQGEDPERPVPVKIAEITGAPGFCQEPSGDKISGQDEKKIQS